MKNIYKALKNMLARTTKRSNKQIDEGDNHEYWMRLKKNIPKMQSSFPSSYGSLSSNQKIFKGMKNSISKRIIQCLERQRAITITLLKNNQGFKNPENQWWWQTLIKDSFSPKYKKFILRIYWIRFATMNILENLCNVCYNIISKNNTCTYLYLFCIYCLLFYHLYRIY